MSTDVSVIMSVFNEEQHLEESLLSLLNQSYSNIEILVVNDGSTDRSNEILARYAKKDPRIQVMQHGQNSGLPKSLNEALGRAQGEFVARMDADDTAMSNRLEKQIRFLRENPQIGAVGSCYREIDSEGRDLPRKQPPLQWDEIKKALFFNNPFCHPSMVFRTDILKKLKGYDESFRTTQDYELYSRMARMTQMANLPDVLIVHRFPGEIFASKKLRTQDRNSMRVRMRMLRAGDVPWYYGLYFLKNILAYCTPIPLREWFRRRRHR